MKEDNISNISCYKYVIIFLCNFNQLQVAVKRWYCFRFSGLDLGYQRLTSPDAVLRATLKRKALYFIFKHIGTEINSNIKNLLLFAYAIQNSSIDFYDFVNNVDIFLALSFSQIICVNQQFIGNFCDGYVYISLIMLPENCLTQIFRLSNVVHFENI